jgi:hypothetical protein
MNYKPDKQRVEDAIIPALLEELMVSHIEQLPDRDPKVYDKALGLLMPDILREINGSDKLCNRLNRLKKVVINNMAKQGWTIPKSYMAVSALADILHQNNLVEFGEGTKEVVSDISEVILENYNDEAIKNQDESALKQAPKLLKIFQKEGYFA